MFKGFKRVVKGGISTVAEKGTDLASNVVGDPDLRPAAFKEKLREGAKNTFKDSAQFVSEGGEDIKDKVGHKNVDNVADKTKEVAHNIKHYGAFGEDYLGYSDPGKDLRKAVKAKEKAAKKAKKAKKKKGEKAEDLFDPENLAKYKKEIEEKRKLASELSPGVITDGSKSKSGSPTSLEGEKLGLQEKQEWEDKQSDEFDFNSPNENQSKSPSGSQGSTKDEGWKQFNALTSGVDHLLKQKKEELDEIKVGSYYQRKKTQDEIDEDAKLARPTTLVGKRKQHWENLDEEGFEEREGVLVADVSDTEDLTEEEEKPETKEPTPEAVEERLPSEEEKEDKEESNDVDEDAAEDEDDIFSTEFVNETLAVLDLKLAVIPDSPVEEDDDIFDTKYASDIVEKAEKEKKAREKVESNRIKFGCISAAADVLTGKASSVDKHAVEHAVKKKRRRANRINLIADEVDDVTALEDIEGITEVDENKPKLDVFGELGDLDVPVGDLLTSTPSPCVIPTTPKQEETAKKEGDSNPILDLSEFDDVRNKGVALTSNVALLEAEFCEAGPEEEEDPFDEAFDQLAKESITKTKLEEIEADLFNDDLFDTSKADQVLNLASLTNVINKQEEEVVLDTFDDKDPFDTSAYDHITKDLEEDLEFECLAKRDPHDLGNCAADIGPDPFDVVDKQIDQNKKEGENDGWAEFDQIKRKKPSRPPPPPRPAPPRPAPPSRPPAVQVDYASGRNTPSVIIKAPSSDSIKSWNVTQSDTLILKCNIEALEASALEEDDEADPFDTTEFEGIVKELKIKEEDPFDTSLCDLNLGPSKTELKLIENEILSASNKNNEAGDKSNLDLLSEEVPEPKPEEEEPEDPFDTGFVEELLPNKGDPFNTDHVDEEDEDFDPFDTTVADKVIPVRKPKVSQKSIVSIEDDDFDPTTAFVVKKAKPPPPPRPSIPPEKLVDPFAVELTEPEPKEPIKVLTPKKEHTQVFAGRARPKTIEQIQKEKQLEEELLNEFGGPLQRSLTDEDFDPRGFDSSPVKEEPLTPESPDPFNTDGIDPFDTSAVQIAG